MKQKVIPVYKEVEKQIEKIAQNKQKKSGPICINGKPMYLPLKEHKVEVVDENSSIEFIDDYYKKMSKKEYEKYQFNYDEIINKKYKKKYTSIYNPITLFIEGFKKIYNYSILKKLLLLRIYCIFNVCAFCSK